MSVRTIGSISAIAVMFLANAVAIGSEPSIADPFVTSIDAEVATATSIGDVERVISSLHWICTLREVSPNGAVRFARIEHNWDGERVTSVSVTGDRAEIVAKMKTEAPSVTVETVLHRVMRTRHLEFRPNPEQREGKARRLFAMVPRLSSPLLPDPRVSRGLPAVSIRCDAPGGTFRADWSSLLRPGDVGRDLDGWVQAVLDAIDEDPRVKQDEAAK